MQQIQSKADRTEYFGPVVENRLSGVTHFVHEGGGVRCGALSDAGVLRTGDYRATCRMCQKSADGWLAKMNRRR